MPGGMKLTSLAVVLSLFLVAAVRAECPAGDLSGDCEIDFEDLQFFAEQWLDPNCEGADCADLDMVDGVNMADFALMGAHWAQIGTPLVINELMASNARFMPDPQGEYDDWIELYNGAEQPVDVGGMYLTDDLDQPRMWRFPTDSPYSTTIDSHRFLWVWTDGDSGDYGLHTNFELDADGEEIALFDKDGSTLIDRVEFGGQTADISYGRYPDGSSQWRFLGLASPRTPNSEAYLGEVADCKFSHKGGFYSYNPRFDRPPLVTIACETEGATIYYTVDGSEPYELSGRFPNGAIYSGPLTIAVRTCLRAKAIKPGWKPSATKTNTYFINETGPIRSLPAISLVAGATTTFYAPDGIMAYPTMRGMAYERPVSFEYTYPQDNSGFQIDCGLRVHGSDWMRPRYSYCPGPGVWEGNCKFSFRPYFRGMYGKSRLEYPIFPFEVDSFKSLVFRGGHNDRVNPFIKDELIRRLFADMGNVSSRGVMANLFINGEYRGYYNPCEHIKEEFCQEWYGSDKGWDVMTMNGIRDGDSVSWNNMLSRVRNYDLSQPSNYAEAARHLDVASFADYLIIELWAGNWDWPQNNWAAASERSEEGKWRFFIWDAEGSMSSGELYTVFFDRLNSQNNANGWLYRSLKSSQTFRHVFADRIYKHFYNDGAMTEANIQRRFYELKNMLYGVIPSMNMYVLNTWVPSRLSTFLNACIQEGVFTFNGPTLKINGSSQYGGPASVGDSLGMSDPQGSGTIYYTVDGSDPRESGALPPVTTTVLAPYSAAKRVLVPTGPVHDNWRGGAAFDDLLWTPCSGSPGGVGYERSSGYGELLSLNVHDQMFAKNCSCLIRIPFYLEDDPAKFESMSLNVWYDDGFVAYLNGNLIKQVLFAGDPSWNSEANGSHEATSIASFDVSGYLGSLRQGNNILAIHGLNYGASSSDFVISAELIARAPGSGGGTTPGRTQYTHPVTLQKTTHIKASIQRGGKWSALGEATFAVGPVAENFRITEMMYHPFNADDPNDPNDPNEEFIELANLGTQELNLYLVRFTKGIDFTFPSLDVAAGERIVVVQDSSTFRARYGGAVRIAGQYEGRLDNGGERIRLEDAIGRTILDFKYKDGWRRVADGHGYSLTMIKPTAPDANSWGEKDNWRASAYEGGSPGEDDGGIIPNPGSVVINEILAHSHAEAPDWIELYNTTDADIDIGGWYLSDSEADLKKYEIAAGTKIKGRNFKLFYEDVNFGEPSSDAGRHTPFAFSENGDELYLTAAKAGVLLGYREYEDFGASETGVSFGRYYKSSTDNTNFVPMDHNTPGQPNAYPQVGPVVISEIMYNPDWPYGGSYVNDQYEYVELHNAGGSEVALYDFDEDEPWKLVDGIDFTFIDVSPVTIPAGGYLVVAKNPEAFAWRYPNVPGELVLGPYDGKLSDGGEKVELAKPGDVDEFGERQYIRVDRVAYSDGAHPGDTPGEVDLWPIAADGAGSSLTRTNMTLYGNDPNNWTAQTPSPAQ